LLSKRSIRNEPVNNTAKNSKISLNGKSTGTTPKRPIMSAYLTTSQRFAR